MEVINQWNCLEFVEYFGNIVEHCPLAAASVWSSRPFRDVTHLISCFSEFLFNLTPQAQEGVLRLHPELGSKQVVKGTQVALSQYSEGEQRGAGLLQLAEDEQMLISELNAKYRVLTSFPFVVCVTEVMGGLSGVLKELQLRLFLLAPGDDGPATPSLVDEERRQAIRAVALICSKRIRRLVDDLSSNQK